MAHHYASHHINTQCNARINTTDSTITKKKSNNINEIMIP